mmetsp:Transcript_15470/g.25302  ORF Transcript_15470/g.25302 Transcript_15470/m.25302 type:complete len:226 (-) Transcript_15470:1115-1792(-)
MSYSKSAILPSKPVLTLIPTNSIRFGLVLGSCRGRSSNLFCSRAKPDTTAGVSKNIVRLPDPPRNGQHVRTGNVGLKTISGDTVLNAILHKNLMPDSNKAGTKAPSWVSFVYASHSFMYVGEVSWLSRTTVNFLAGCAKSRTPILSAANFRIASVIDMFKSTRLKEGSSTPTSMLPSVFSTGVADSWTRFDFSIKVSIRLARIVDRESRSFFCDLNHSEASSTSS